MVDDRRQDDGVTTNTIANTTVSWTLGRKRTRWTLLAAFLVMFLTASNFSFALRSSPFVFTTTLEDESDFTDPLSSPSIETTVGQSTTFDQTEEEPPPTIMDNATAASRHHVLSNITSNIKVSTMSTKTTEKLTLDVPHLFHYSPDLVKNLSTTFQYWSREANWHFVHRMGGVYQQNMTILEAIMNDTSSQSHQHDWCIPQTVAYYRSRQFRTQPVVGLMFSKSPKAASSTGAAVAIQISKNVAQRQNYTLPCASNYSHPFSFHKSVQRRTFPSIAFTHVRHPAKLALSMFYHFGVTRLNETVEDAKVIKAAEELKGAQTGYIGGGGGGGKKNFDPARIHKQVLGVYDFVAVVERMEESLVAMKILWHLEHEDIIVLNSKVAGRYSPTGKKHCEKIPKSVLTPALKHYFETNHTQDNIDYLLYAVVNATLDRTIEETIGRDLFDKELRIHQQLTALAKKDCPMEEYAPCTSEGVRRKGAKCLEADMGCGHECVHQSVLRHKAAVMEPFSAR